MTRPRLVLLGIDAADSRVVRRWAGEGRLPALADLLASGLVAPVETPVADDKPAKKSRAKKAKS